MKTYRLYDLLGTQKGASDDEIKRAFRKMAVKEHPDKGGDPEKFKEISNAYTILSDPEKKRAYDNLGDDEFDAVSKGGGGPGGHPFEGFDGNPFNIFEHMFFGGGMRGRPAEAEVIQHKIKITLEDVYKGVQKNIRMTFQRDCSKCKQSCSQCRGTGMQEKIIQMAIFQQVIRSPCDACQGRGSTSKISINCSECKGKGSVPKEEHFHLSLPIGTPDGAQQMIRLANYHVMFHIEVVPHNVFVRENNHLLMRVQMTLLESITGKNIIIPHFDGTFTYNTRSAGIVTHNQVIIIERKGIPVSENNPTRGDLKIICDVVGSKTSFPEHLVSELTALFKNAGI